MLLIKGSRVFLTYDFEETFIYINVGQQNTTLFKIYLLQFKISLLCFKIYLLQFKQMAS